MALSTAIKNKMLSVTHLQYRRIVEIKNEDGDWIDFTSRDPIFPALRLATEKGRHKVVSSIASVAFTNDDNYFDWMDDPSHATTISTFGTLATKFSKGFRGKQVRFSLRVRLPDNTHEDARMGLYRVRRMKVDPDLGRAVFDLWQDVDFLKKLGTEDISSGKRHHENKPVSYLVREILKKFYRGGITASEFEIPDRIYLTTSDGEPAFSHYGKPPEKDTDGRWRDDVTKKPTALIYDSDSDLFYCALENEIWSFDSDAEEWDKVGEFSDEDVHIKGFFKYDSTHILAVAWETIHGQRRATLTSGYIDTSAGTFTQNSSSYDIETWSGEHVLRDAKGTTTNYCYMGNLDNNGAWSIGVNMPNPYSQYVHSCLVKGGVTKQMGFPASSLRDAPAVGEWQSVGVGTPSGTNISEPCYVAFKCSYAPPVWNEVSGVKVYWGMPVNLAWDSTRKFLYVVKMPVADSPMGINLGGWVRITAIKNYTASDQHDVTSQRTDYHAPAYCLSFLNDGTDEWAYWVEVNWKEPEGASPAGFDGPDFMIYKGEIKMSGSDPEIADIDIAQVWKGADDLFAVADDDYAPITIFPYYKSGVGVGFIVQILDIADIGNDCFKLYYVNSGFTSATKLEECYQGWANFTFDSANEIIYAQERDTGRIIEIDVSTAPTSFNYVGDSEPISQSYFEMPNPSNGLIVRTEDSKICLYGIGYPSLPPGAQEDKVPINGKYYFWKYHPQLTDRVELFEEDKQGAWEALGLLAQVVGYQVGFDPEGTGFFRELPDGSGSSAFTIDLDSPIGRHFTAKKLDGMDAIINRSQFIPYEAAPGMPEAGLDLIGYIKSGSQVYFNGQTEVRSETTEEKNITLHCIKGGSIGTAEFKYLIHDFQIKTKLREAVNPGDLDLIRLDSNQDVEVDMRAQVGYYEGTSDDMHVDVIETDGDIDLSENLDRAYERGTPVTFRSSEQAAWSTEYDTPATYTSSSTFSEIGSTGLFLKFTADGSPINFAVGDRIDVYNPGMIRRKSRTKKFSYEDSPSIETYEATEYKLDNPYISLTLGVQLIKGIIDDESDPHHEWQIKCPLFLQAKSLALVTMKSRKHLPTATNNEEKCYVKQVQHDERNAKTTLIVRAVSAYV